MSKKDYKKFAKDLKQLIDNKNENKEFQNKVSKKLSVAYNDAISERNAILSRIKKTNKDLMTTEQCQHSKHIIDYLLRGFHNYSNDLQNRIKELFKELSNEFYDDDPDKNIIIEWLKHLKWL